MKERSYRNALDIEIASCYDQIEVLKNKIRLLEEQKTKEESSSTNNDKEKNKK